MENERWIQSGSVILSSGKAWVCIMADPQLEQARPIGLSSQHWDEAMERARLIILAPEMLKVCKMILQAEQEADEDANFSLLCEATELAGSIIKEIKEAEHETT